MELIVNSDRLVEPEPRSAQASGGSGEHDNTNFVLGEGMWEVVMNGPNSLIPECTEISQITKTSVGKGWWTRPGISIVVEEG